VINHWIELLNPFSTDASLNESGAARLQMPKMGMTPSYPVYQILVDNQAQANPFAAGNIRAASNTKGDLNPFPLTYGNGNVRTTVSDYTPDAKFTPVLMGDAINQVQPAGAANYSGAAQSNAGFYVLGPADSQYTTTNNPTQPQSPNLPLPSNQVMIQTLAGGIPSGLTYHEPVASDPTAVPAKAVYLRRLACPYLPPNPDIAGNVGAGPYNPYITVDYVSNVPVNNGTLYDSKGVQNPNTSLPSRVSVGRKQPYAALYTASAAYSQILAQAPQPAPTTTPQHTFYRHNAVEAAPGPPSAATAGQTLTVPFDWLVHRDRAITSPLDILHVSVFKPHELTQQFYAPPDPTNAPTAAGGANPLQAFRHNLSWAVLDQSSRLFRVFEFLEAHPRNIGVAAGGRIPGLLNINTIWDQEILAALADPQLANNFSTGFYTGNVVFNASKPYDTVTFYGQLITARNPNMSGSNQAFSQTDRPFLGMAAPVSTGVGDVQYPSSQYLGGGVGINDTFLRLNSGSAAPNLKALFEVPGASHPAQRFELMTKLFNNVTTRSNVFAVWVTVGLFEVQKNAAGQYIGENSRPVKLGAELGKSEGRNIRHRMFAIVDRTNLNLAGPGPGNSPPMYIKTTSDITVPPAAMAPFYPNSTANVSFTVDTASGNYEALSYNIQANVTQLLVDVGPNPGPGNNNPPTQPETVTVTKVVGNTLQATFSYPHPKGTVIAILNATGTNGPGNPGPQQRYNPRQDPMVVRYFSIIK
jgi:hypothetical protein